jgi:ubiquinone/menaquinone biosynthesis C-methylase UbiE
MVEAESDIAGESFDAAVCIEVLEHVPDPPAVMREIHRALKLAGIALITESFDSIGDDYPSHLPSNFKYAGRTHQIMEEIGFANTYYNIDPVNRPMEFTKVRDGFSGELFKIRGKLRRAIDSRWRHISRVAGHRCL